MGIYSDTVFNNRGGDSPIITDTIDTIMEDDSIALKDENEDFVSEGLDIISTMIENYSMFCRYMGSNELFILEQTGSPMIYTENVLTNLASTIKKFLMKIWEKIKSLFKRFIMMIDSYTKNDRAFINKYRQQIYRHKSLSDFSFKGYRYTIDIGKISNAMDHCHSKYINDKVLEKAKLNPYESNVTSDTLSKDLEKFDETFESTRGEIIHLLGGSNGKYTSEEFRKELKLVLRHNEEEKEELTDKEIDVDGMITELQNYRETKKTVDSAFKNSKKAIDSDIKEIDRMQKDWLNTPVSNPNDTTIEIKAKPAIVKDQTESDDEWWDRVKDEKIDIDLAEVDQDGNVSTPGTAMSLTLNDIMNGKAKNLFDENEKEEIKNKLKSVNDFDIRKKIGDKDVSYFGISNGVFRQNKNKVVIRQAVPGVETKNSEISKRGSKRIHLASKTANMSKTMLIDINVAVLQALKERSRQYKACLVKIAHYNPKNEEAYNESYSYNNQFQQNFTSPLSNIEFK